MGQRAKKMAALVLLLAGVGLAAEMLYRGMLEPAPSVGWKTVGFISTRNEDKFGDVLEGALKTAIQESGCDLLDVSADNTQESQSEAVRVLLSASVDVIVFSPVCENGWDELLKEANQLDIAVVTVLESLNNQDLCTVYEVGGDYDQQAAQLMEYMDALVKEPSSIFVLSGTISSSLTRALTSGLQRSQTNHLSVSNRAYGNFMRSRGKEIARGIFRHNNEIDVIVAHNEAMALGAIDALEELGIGSEAVHVCFFGGTLEEASWSESGYVSCAVLYDVPTLTECVLEAVNAARPEDTGSHSIPVPFRLVTKEETA